MLAHVRASAAVPVLSRRPAAYPAPAGGMAPVRLRSGRGRGSSSRPRHSSGTRAHYHHMRAMRIFGLSHLPTGLAAVSVLWTTTSPRHVPASGPGPSIRSCGRRRTHHRHNCSYLRTQTVRTRMLNVHACALVSGSVCACRCDGRQQGEHRRRWVCFGVRRRFYSERCRHSEGDQIHEPSVNRSAIRPYRVSSQTQTG
jgi:hypothetical protein